MKLFKISLLTALIGFTGPSCASVSKGESSHAPKYSERADWCSRLTSGPASLLKPEFALSQAHSYRRFFGVGSRYSHSDQALAKALEFQKIDASLDLKPYADSLLDTCALEAQPARPVGQIELRVESDVAWIRPGRGALNLPSSMKAVVLDLTDPPNAPGSREALLNTVAQIIHGELKLPARRGRHHSGMTDEHFSPRGVYENGIDLTDSSSIIGPLRTPIAIYVIAGPHITSDAAEIAGTLRLEKRAFLVGGAVSTAVAESIWMPVGQRGLAFRIHEFVQGDKRWPDSIPADMSFDEMKQQLAVSEAQSMPAPKPIDSNSLTNLRPTFEVVLPHRDIQAARYGLGDLRAALLVAHGALRLFFANFDDLGDRLDPRLTEVLTKVDQLNEAPTIGERRDYLRRLSAALNDGHSFVFTQPADPAIKGYLPIVIETLGGKAVVRRSGLSGVHAGDTILRIGHRDVRSLYREQLALSSSSSDGYRYDIAAREFIKLKEPVELLVRGHEPRAPSRKVTAQPVPMETLLKLQPSTPVIRKSGWLEDLGFKKVFYLNLSDESVNTVEVFGSLVREAADAERIILDVRGYPRIDLYEIAQRLICEKAQSPILRIVALKSPFERSFIERSRELTPLPSPNYCGPLALLVGPHTVSSAEQISMMFVDAKRVRVYGDSVTAGSNGNVTGLQLPGSLVFTFTGMKALHADGSRFIGRGIKPDVIVAPSSKDFAVGNDPVLRAAAGAK